MSDCVKRSDAMTIAFWFGHNKYNHKYIKKRVMEIPSANHVINISKDLKNRIFAHKTKIPYWWCIECDRLDKDCRSVADAECFLVPTKFIERKEYK